MEGMSRNLVKNTLFFLIILAQTDAVYSSPYANINISGILDAQLKGYDQRIRPNYGGPTVDVGVTMYIISISSVSEVQMDYTMDLYFRQYWTDERLAFKNQPEARYIKQVTVGDMAAKIWMPDTFFVNEKSAYFHYATTENSFLKISSEGEITRSLRLTVTAACPMDLQYFPMDRQLCNLEIESYGFTMADIRYNWAKGEQSVGISRDVQLPQFRVMGHRQKKIESYLTTGNYSRLACEILLVRSLGYYLIQMYIPASLIVMVSWVSFWINRDATTARVALGVTTVLTMTTLMSSVNAALPKISYIKSIDVFLGTCFVMVFASLLEYATVGYLGKKIEMRKTRFQVQQKKQGPVHLELLPRSDTPHANSKEFEFKRQPNDLDAEFANEGLNRIFGCKPSDIDKYSRVIFPVCFICFNLSYWTVYLHISSDTPEDVVPLPTD